MDARHIAHYRIVRPLGSGGMGNVLLAHDVRLDRRVALKLLPPELARDEERLARLRREARAIAALDHPNVVRIHAIEEAEGATFLVMERVVGRTLAAIMAEKRLDLEQINDLGAQLADGLAAAHRAGVVHRDLKPANVMVSDDGVLKVLDFGLAIWLDGRPEQIPAGTVDPAAPTETAALTAAGSVMGTAPYMAPEQVRGQPATAATDVFALGAVLYEMITGSRPFAGNSRAELYSAILRDSPAPVRELRPEAPAALAELIERCLAKDVEERPRSMADVRDRLRALADEAEAAPERSVAVLPFVDMSAARDQEYFCEGIAEQLLYALSRIEGLRVAARTSTFCFKGKSVDVREIGRYLGVGAVVEGSLRKSGDRLRITAQLVDTANGYRLWSEQFDRRFEDVFAIQDEITDSIVSALELALAPGEDARIEHGTRNPRAYDHYLRGRSFFYRQTRRDQEAARRLFAEAIEEDPAFARAWAGAADCCSFLYKHFGHDPEHLQEALRSSRRALDLDPRLAEAHSSHGFALSLSGELDRADEEFEEAVRLDPHLFDAHYLYGHHMTFTRGDREAGARLFERAADLRPDDYQAPMLLAGIHRAEGRDDESRRQYRRAYENACSHLALHPDDVRALYLGGAALVQLDQIEEGLEWATRAAEADGSAIVLYNVAAAHALAGRDEQALDYLEQSLAAGFTHRVAAELDPDFDRLADDPGFRRILDRMDAAGH
ncbi:MAG TPA: protein kinase [Thermoanaerobaculia bacterium]|nr:protein kinase [Thermoanaerobaculia bacterium]